jgi:hypothetical protein
MANPMLAPALSFLGRLKYPQLFKLAAILFAVDLVIPDVIPFLDEILLATGTLILGNWKRRRDDTPVDPGR